jgi:hypothetical protein
MSKAESVTVPLTEAQRFFVQSVAEQESISKAAVVRRLVAEAARRVIDEAAQQNRAPLSPWPVRPATKLDTPEEIAAARSHLATLERERDQLDKIKAPGLMPDQCTRLGVLHHEIAMLRGELMRTTRGA